jgi:hypothetical protein
MSYLWTASRSSLINIRANMSFDKISINTQLSLKPLLNLNAIWQHSVGNTKQWWGHDFHKNCESLNFFQGIFCLNFPEGIVWPFTFSDCQKSNMHLSNTLSFPISQI